MFREYSLVGRILYYISRKFLATKLLEKIKIIKSNIEKYVIIIIIKI
jgi:hypothetical protein